MGVLAAAAVVAEERVGHGVEDGRLPAAVAAGQHPQRPAVEADLLLLLVTQEAAELDGLNAWGVLVRVAVPVALPALGIAVMFGFLTAWNEFIFALSLTRSPEAATMPVGIAGYITNFRTFWGPMTASASIYTIPVLIVTLFAQRGLVRGLLGGAIKA